MPDKFLERTQNICKHCDKRICRLGGIWIHRDTASSYCRIQGTGPLVEKAEPKFEEGSPEHLKAIK